MLPCVCATLKHTASARLLAADSTWQRLQLREQLLLALLDAQVRKVFLPVFAALYSSVLTEIRVHYAVPLPLIYALLV